MSDFSDTIARLATGVYTVIRTVAGTLANGRYTPGTQSTFSIKALAVPLSGIDLQRLPEGMRSRDCRTLFTSTALKTKEPGFDPDIITIKGINYQVYQNQPWDDSGNYFKVLLVAVLQ